MCWNNTSQKECKSTDPDKSNIINDVALNEAEDINTPSEEETINSEPKYVPEPNPWDDAPAGVWFYDIQYEDGHLGNMTQSAERAYKRGWDMSNNIPVDYSVKETTL